MNVNISEAERKVYVKYFEQIDGDRDGVIGAREVIRLRETGVSDQVLGFIWANCVLPPAEGLSLDAFFLAMRIISLSQHLLPPDLSLARSSPSFLSLFSFLLLLSPLLLLLLLLLLRQLQLLLRLRTQITPILLFLLLFLQRLILSPV